MISPDIKDLMRNMDSRYTLVVTAAKRARQLTDGAEPLTRFRSDKTVTLAVHEIAEGKVDYFRDAGARLNRDEGLESAKHANAGLDKYADGGAADDAGYNAGEASYNADDAGYNADDDADGDTGYGAGKNDSYDADEN